MHKGFLENIEWIKLLVVSLKLWSIFLMEGIIPAHLQLEVSLDKLSISLGVCIDNLW